MKTDHVRVFNMVLLLLAMLTLAMLFVGHSGPYASRSFKAFWNLGHLLAFFLWTLLVLQTLPRLTRMCWPRRLLICLTMALVLGVLIEYLQVPLGRQAELADVINDVLGSLLAFIIHTGIRQQTALMPLVSLLFAVCLAVAWHNRVGLIHVYDDVLARQQFPVLLDFSMPTEITRIEGDAVTELIHHDGVKYLRLLHDTRQYSGFALKYFPRDWRGYEAIQIHMFNPEPKAINLTCRIHDIAHSDGYEEYDDRFNRSYIVGPGQNTIEIPLEVVATAPATRRLDLSQVGGLGCFTTNQNRKRELYLRSVRLLNQE